MYTALRIAQGVHRGDFSATGLVEDSLARIARLDRQVQAWVLVDDAGARTAAQQMAVAGRREGPLIGVPVGIKDIYDVVGLPTRAGAAAFAHYTPGEDSVVVRRLREAGAIIMGKTHTTEFAYLDPAPTRNPWNLEHTPGGSSSGSAAAVAAGMVPVAIGSQTVGSTIRPAAYCGIVGFKPTHGRVSLRGVVPLAPQFDHAGIFSRSVLDAALVLNVLAGYDRADPYSSQQETMDYLEAARSQERPPVLGVPWRFFRDIANREVNLNIERLTGVFEKEGATVRDIELPVGARDVIDLGQPILRSQAATAHARRFTANRERYGPHIRALVEAGLRVPDSTLAEAQEARRGLQDALIEAIGEIDALLLPSAPTTAPEGLSSTGDGIFCAPASFTGLPSIALPSGNAERGLPLSVQLIGWPFTEGRLLSAAAWVERAVDFRLEPALTNS